MFPDASAKAIDLLDKVRWGARFLHTAPTPKPSFNDRADAAIPPRQAYHGDGRAGASLL